MSQFDDTAACRRTPLRKVKMVKLERMVRIEQLVVTLSMLAYCYIFNKLTYHSLAIFHRKNENLRYTSMKHFLMTLIVPEMF
jgi:hypothetical protein